MTTLISTFALTPSTQSGGWDLYTDSFGNIAQNTQAAAVAQDVASAIKLFLCELYYDTTQGVPYNGQIFSQTYNAAIINSAIQQAALSVPNVVDAVASVTNQNSAGQPTRNVTGTVRILDVNGQELGVTL